MITRNEFNKKKYIKIKLIFFYIIMFFIDFLAWYSQLSIMCLIKDIFAGEINIIKYDLQVGVV